MPSVAQRTCTFASAALVALVFLAVVFPAADAAAEADFETCWAAYEEGRWSDAAPCFEEIVAEWPDWAFGHHYLGVSYHQLKKTDKALESFMKAMDLMPDDAEPAFEPYFMAAQVLEGKKRYSAAMDALKRGESYATAEQVADSLACRGRISYNLDKYDKAIADLKKSGRKDFITLYYLGTAHYLREEYGKAADYLEAALKKRSDSGTAHFLALSFFKRAEATSDKRTREQLYGRVAEVGKSLLEANPDSVDGHNLIGRAHMGAGDYGAAERSFKKVLELKPSHCYARANLANLYLSKKHWTKADREARAAIECLPKRERRDMHVVRGHCLYGRGKALSEKAGDDDLGDRKEAIRLINQAKGEFGKALGIRSSAGVQDQVNRMDEAAAGIQSEIDTIERNRITDAENKKTEEENRQMREALDKARSGGGSQ